MHTDVATAQFGLRQLFVFTAVVGVTFGLVRLVGGYAFIVPIAWFFATFVNPQSGPARRDFALAAWFWGALSLAHGGCSLIAYETLGEVNAGIYGLTLPAHVVPAVLCAVGRVRRGLIVGLLLLTIVAAPQLILLLRLVALRGEVSRIVAYADGVKTTTGQYPANLTGYTPGRPGLMSNINYFPSQDHYMVLFWTVDSSMSHWYSVSSGWGYDPD